MTMLTRSETRAALLASGERQAELFAEARRLRAQWFGQTVVVRGVVELTNVCRVNCEYCPMRRDNAAHNDRFFAGCGEIMGSVRAIYENGIDVVLLQGGETPTLLPTLRDAIPAIRDLYDGRVEVLLNLGSMTRGQYLELRELGATGYIIKHETSDPDLHQRIRHEDIAVRLRCLSELLDMGHRVGTGLISGLPGQSLDSIVRDIELAGEYGVQMCSVSPFIPAAHTPLANAPAGSLELALNIIACLRIRYPRMLIPSVSALERTNAGGQSRGLVAGANVVTVNFTGEPQRNRYHIYGDERFVVGLRHMRDLVSHAGMTTRGSVFLSEPAPR